MFYSIVATFALAFIGVVASAGVLRLIEDTLLSQPAYAESGTTCGFRNGAQATPAPRPKIRVGLYTTDEPVTVQAAKKIDIVAGDEKTLLKTISANQEIILKYDRASAIYTISSGDWTTTSTDYVIAQPRRSNTVVTISSYSNPPAWNTALNDNQFFGTIALRYAEATDRIWVINELGIENYVQGVAEATNDNEPAYLKALYTAARGYALYHYSYPTKHVDEHYTLDTTANDQLYRGYSFSQRAPNVVAAVRATAGQIVHYQDEPVVTPYFSQSDGRTRAWSEIWSGEYPYLQSVSDPCCTGDELLGHGVGLSAKGARYFAATEHWHWREILEYYYQDTTLKQLW